MLEGNDGGVSPSAYPEAHAEQQWLAAERELLGEMVAQIPALGKSTSSPRAGSKRAAQRKKSA
jgi:hypothetical protein